MERIPVQETHALDALLQEVRQCRLCADELPAGPNPVVQASATARVLVVGQAPGRRVHETGIPFNDPSGNRLRQWRGVDRETFYDASRVAILPMAFCYPGTGKNGDLPPLARCADTWRETLLAHLPRVQLTLVIGRYAQAWHLPEAPGKVTATVRDWQRWWPDVVPLPHPSPRNLRWLKQNPWFEADVVPALQTRIRAVLAAPVNTDGEGDST